MRGGESVPIIGHRKDGSPVLPIAGGADGIYYRDMRQPFVIADQGAITLSTTQKALWTPSLTVLPANYWTVGKTVKMTALLKIVTGITPGNFSFAMAYGAGDAPAPIVTTVARAAVASVTTPCMIQGYATCRSTGTAGTLSMWGWFVWDLAGQLSTAGPSVFPSNASTVVSAIDTTVGTNALTFQASRSGSTAETVATVSLIVEALN